MTARIIDGNAIAKQIRRELADQVRALTIRGLTPGLAVILVGDDPASLVYVGKKVKACSDVGIASRRYQFSADVSPERVYALIDQLNADRSGTRDLAQFTILADILIVAAGRPALITAEMVKTGAVVIDVGINRLADGRLVGDVDFEPVARKASHITPVPGGVGPMTVTMLLHNTLQSAQRAMAVDPKSLSRESSPAHAFAS